jgi:hypothetical protein
MRSAPLLPSVFSFLALAGVGLCTPAPLGAQEEQAALVAFQKDVVMRLAGGSEIASGLRLENRASPENKVAARAYLEGLLDSLGLEPRRQPYRENGENVFALLPATAPSDDFVVIGAHFDSTSRGPGANDDATGCALVLGVAEYLVAMPSRSSNVFIVFFDEEERGMQGSRAFAQKLVDEGKKVVAVHTIDQMGWDADGDGAIELELPYDGAVELYREAAESLGLDTQLEVTEETGSDHSAFRRLGMPAVGLTEEYRNGDTTPHIHRATDTWDTVNFEYLANVTILARRALAALVK